MAGDYPKLDGLFVTVTTLEECDLSQCTTPKLKSIYLSYNSLEKIKLPLGASDLGNLSLRTHLLIKNTTILRKSRLEPRELIPTLSSKNFSYVSGV